MSKKKILIIGAGQFGIIVSNILKNSKEFEIIGFIDNNSKKLNKKINKIKVVGTDKKLNFYKKKKINLAIAIFDTKKRNQIIKRYQNGGFLFPKIFHNSCNIEKNVKIGKGTIITNSSIVLNNTTIGKFCLIGSGIKILHHVSIADNCVIGGGTTVGSNVQIEKNVFVGVGAVFASKKIKVGKNSYVCSGSVVMNNIRERSKVIGNPARSIPLKSN